MLTRRACLLGGAAAATVPQIGFAAADSLAAFNPNADFPHKSAFRPFAGTYLNCASQHPVSIDGQRAINAYLDYKSFAEDTDFSNFGTYQRVLDNYAELINANHDEVCFVQSTTVGENLVLKALDIDSGSRIVTDDLHYVGSLPTYVELEKRGVEVVTVRATDSGEVTLDQYDAAIDDNTRLICLSSVSMVNGFQQDLQGLCELAHAKGALVYADVVHEVGSMPFNVKHSNVDFCSSASYKWLMGEQGLGFLYARKDRLAELQRPWYGHYQLQARTSFAFPNPNPSDAITEYEHHDAALGYFAMGSQANIVAALLDYSLQYLMAVDPRRIQAFRQPMIERLQEALPRLGYASLTPRDSRTALVSFRHDGNTAEIRSRLKAANIVISVAQQHMRISPSVFNDLNDIEKLIDALS